MHLDDMSEFHPEGRAAALDREIARRNREIAVKQAAADYRARLADERTKAAAELVERVLGDPGDAEEYSGRPMELVKLAAVAESGLDVRGVALLADYCAKRAAILDPAKYGGKPNQVLVLDVASLLDAAAARVRRLASGSESPVIEGEIIPPSSAA